MRWSAQPSRMSLAVVGVLVLLLAMLAILQNRWITRPSKAERVSLQADLDQAAANRVIVLGIDGLDPGALELLVSEGKLRNFALLREKGAHGTLRARSPLLSPLLWTTIATGKSPDEHGIGHFVAVDPLSGDEIPATSTMRRVKAVWNLASEMGRQAAVVGWWATWPPEAIDGWIVSDHTCYHFLSEMDALTGAGRAVTHPADLIEEISPLIRRPMDITYEEALRYVNVPREDFNQPFRFADEISHLRWAIATAETYTATGLDLWRRYEPELLMVYVEGTDSVSHLFGHLFRAEGLAGELEEQYQRHGHAVEEIYRRADEIVGAFLAVLDPMTTLIVLSDHGFDLGKMYDDPSKTRDLRRVSETAHRELGVLYLYGRAIRTGVSIDEADQLDITPTILTLLGLPTAVDMPGRVLTEALGELPDLSTVGSFEDPTSSPAYATGSSVDSEVVAHLESLGYLGNTSRSPQSDRNLAAMAFESGDYAKARASYEALIAEDSGNASLYSSLAGCLGAQERYSEALDAINTSLELDPTSIEALHNRAVIHERLGNRHAAIIDYRRALRYQPGYEPSRRALLRLTGSPDARPPRNAHEAMASQIAEEGAAKARHGAYEEAMILLDRAARIAPDYVLVHQYRANVAFLLNDLESAKTALTRALELEPDNEVFARNLVEVRRKLGSGP